MLPSEVTKDEVGAPREEALRAWVDGMGGIPPSPWLNVVR